MKRCPHCKRTFNDEALNFCLADGSPLVVIDAPSSEIDSTTRYPASPDTNPPRTEVYRPPATVVNQPPPVVPQWSPMPPAQAPRKSRTLWWILGGIAIAILGAGLVVVLIVIGVLTSESNTTSSNTNSNTTANKNINRSGANNANSSSPNTNASSNLPASLSDDFSTKKWGTGSSQFGDFWYTDDEYHMRAKDKTYLMMYGPSNDYNTENATVRVTVRNVDGVSPRSGYGLVVHCAKKAEKFEYYTFLIYTSEKPRYKVGMYKGSDETSLVEWTESNVVRTGTNTNKLEVRIKGSELSFYVNSQRVTSITDSAGFKRGLAGFYTSDAHEVAFDDLEITR
jgi:hypothetical protein